MNSYAPKSQTTKEIEATEVPNAPEDTVSDISLADSLMAVSSWDGCVRIYKKNHLGGFEPLKIYENLGAPVLSVCLIGEAFVVAGLVDGNIVAVDMRSEGVRKTIKAHDNSVKAVRLMNNFVVTASFDGFYKIFDSEFKEVHSVNMQSKIYCMDCVGEYLALGLRNKKAVLVNLATNKSEEFMTSFEYAIRSIAISPTRFGVDIAVGSVEGKIQVFNTNTKSSFTMRQHRQDEKLYSVNQIRFLDENMLLSGGSDGFVYVINKATKYKMAGAKYSAPITAMVVQNRKVAFAVGDDWSKGFQQQYTRPEIKISDLQRL
ncbi:RAE1 [Enterospora canceri]|uniref:RAE1 n=1 Tax=Enterospora canceri TaxID=1081671 RepID=A0A1Y1S5S8_9MICR|nr:RAE1 [Enterospora canceri]